MLVSAPGAVVEDNVVSNAAPSSTPSAGIVFLSSDRITAVGNRIVNMREGIAFRSSTGIYMDNTVGGATVAPYAGGTAAGSTNFSF